MMFKTTSIKLVVPRSESKWQGQDLFSWKGWSGSWTESGTLWWCPKLDRQLDKIIHDSGVMFKYAEGTRCCQLRPCVTTGPRSCLWDEDGDWNCAPLTPRMPPLVWESQALAFLGQHPGHSVGPQSLIYCLDSTRHSHLGKSCTRLWCKRKEVVLARPSTPCCCCHMSVCACWLAYHVYP